MERTVPKLPVPPNAVLIYDVKLVGINGINVPTDDPAALGTRIPYDYQVFFCLPPPTPPQRRITGLNHRAECTRGPATQKQDCKKLEGRAFECGPDVKGRRL